MQDAAPTGYAVKKVFPDCTPLMCQFHVIMNIKKCFGSTSDQFKLQNDVTRLNYFIREEDLKIKLSEFTSLYKNDKQQLNNVFQIGKQWLTKILLDPVAIYADQIELTHFNQIHF